jgi:predicted AlkP superfamily pyrophosphatase or phosphodiesterase
MLGILTLVPAYAEDMKYNSIVLISIDALHPDAVKKENCPNIYSILQKGVYSPDGVSTKPPKTLIAHTAMITGLTPDKNGKTDNNWKKGEPKISKPTMLTAAKNAGFETILIYSKPKLGYLADSRTDKDIYSADDAIEKAVKNLDVSRKQFIFLHISGLDFVGPESGWMSEEYMEEFRFIDEQLAELFDKLEKSPSYLLIVTSDHAGHGKIHGSDHPEDYKRPLAAYSSIKKLNPLTQNSLQAHGLKDYIEAEYLK